MQYFQIICALRICNHLQNSFNKCRLDCHFAHCISSVAGNAEIRLHWTLVYLSTGNSSTIFPVIQALEFGILEHWKFVYTFFEYWKLVYSFLEYWNFVYCSIGHSSTHFLSTGNSYTAVLEIRLLFFEHQKLVYT